LTSNKQSFAQGAREWIWPLALATTVFLASGRSQVAAPEVPGIDKIAHFFVYGLLGTLIARVPRVADGKGLGLYWAVVAASLYGITDEFHQSFTPGRSVEFADWAMDTCGSGLAVWVYARWRWYRAFLECSLMRTRVEISGQPATDLTT